MCVRVFVAQKTLTLAKKTHLTNKKYIRQSLKKLFASVRPWIGKFAIGQKKSQPYNNEKRHQLEGYFILDTILSLSHPGTLAGS